MKTLWLLVGEMGSGKSYWGKKLAQYNNFKFVEGDRYLPPAMHQAVKKFGKVTEDMKGMLLNNLERVAHEVLASVLDGSGVIISQALYSEGDRQWLIQRLRQSGYAVELWWVSPGFWRNLKQLWRRPRGFRWVLYWLMSKPWFERPRGKHMFLDKDNLAWFRSG